MYIGGLIPATFQCASGLLCNYFWEIIESTLLLVWFPILLSVFVGLHLVVDSDKYLSN